MKPRLRTVMWALAGLLVLSLLGIAIGTAHLLGYDPTGTRRAAPDFDLPLVAGDGAAEGDRVALEGLRGQVVLLDFWASWCQPCRRSIPALNAVHERYEERIRMYGVNVEGELSPSQIRAAHRAFGAQFPTLLDVDGSAQEAYRVTGIPTLVLIDRTGTVRWVHSGEPDPEEVSERVDDLLGQNR